MSMRPEGLPEKKREAWATEVVRAVPDAINPSHRIAVVLGVGCGLRQGEVFGAVTTDIDFDAKEIHVCRQVQLDGNTMFYKLPKDEKACVVPMSASVAAELLLHMRTYAPAAIELPWAEADSEKKQAHALVLTNAAGNSNNFKSWNVRPGGPRSPRPE
ncbi:hypothetical protein OOK13_19715 [Streptomyces sp. NBC_00378]|uniref:hypothetical protein n=1 Tax=unclassified Streptomyces TaxID=2593676 RepID=UPI0022589A9E|nr:MULTISPECIES: hypothetical protein [unclassified Streptomyces]MCX5110731.1 hypothetical protein [Streptomyces sp. NBC_00378]